MIDDSELIAEILAAGLANQRIVQQALAHSEQTGESLYRTLIHQDLVDERDVVAIASELLNVPYVDLSTLEVDEAVIELLPEELARETQSLPLELIDDGEARTLRLAMVDPIDVMAMDDVANHTGVNIRPVLVGPAGFEKALEQFYQRSSFADRGASSLLEGRSEDDSWAALFDDPSESSSLHEESSVLSQEMRDRPPTDIFEVVDDDILESDPFGGSSLSGLVSPVEGSQAMERINLDDWELDDAFGSVPPAPPENLPPMPARALRNDQTLIGVGIRGALEGLGLQGTPFESALENSHIEEEEDEDFDGGLMGFELPSISGGDEDEDQGLQEISAPSLEHSIEMALDLGDFVEAEEESLPSPLDGQATIAVNFDAKELAAADFMLAKEQREKTAPRMRFDDYDEPLFGEGPEVVGFDLQEISKPLEEEKLLKTPKTPKTPKSIRAALKRAVERKEENRDPGEDSTLGRIKVKRVAVPKFQGAVEKRSDQIREKEEGAARGPDDPATRELSVDDLMGLTASARETAEAIPISAMGTDLELLLQGLLRVLVAKEILSQAELEKLLAEAIRDGEAQ